MPRNNIGNLMESLTAGLPEEDKEAITSFEKVLCAVFGKQFAHGGMKCFTLRRSIVDFHKHIKEGNRHGRLPM